MNATMQVGLVLMKNLVAVGAGCFVGGGARYLVACAARHAGLAALPVATFAVNVTGCFAIGFLASYHTIDGRLAPRTRLMLTTGFCGGFTTFSTFMSENAALWREGHYALLSLYVVGSFAAGWAALIAGHALARSME